MPTIRNAWAKIADAPDDEVQAYRGLRQQHLELLNANGVDTTAYLAAKGVFSGLSDASTTETRKRIEENYVRGKRSLLQALAGLAMKKVGKGLEAAQARNMEASQLNKEVDTELKTALQGLQGVVAAICSAGKSNYQQKHVLRRQYDGLEACDRVNDQALTALRDAAADDADDTALAAALVQVIGCEAPAALHNRYKNGRTGIRTRHLMRPRKHDGFVSLLLIRTCLRPPSCNHLRLSDQKAVALVLESTV